MGYGRLMDEVLQQESGRVRYDWNIKGGGVMKRSLVSVAMKEVQ